MRRILLSSVLVLGVSGIASTTEAACNIRGEFCGYPGWAANAFTHPRNRVPESALDNPTNRTAVYPPDRRYYKYRAKRYPYRYR